MKVSLAQTTFAYVTQDSRQKSYITSGRWRRSLIRGQATCPASFGEQPAFVYKIFDAIKRINNKIDYRLAQFSLQRLFPNQQYVRATQVQGKS